MRLMRLQFKDGKKIDGWIKAKNISDVTLQEVEQANLRELYDNEIVLDCESKLEAVKVRRMLKENGVAYTEWDTSSRGKHFHLLIDGLQAVNEQERLLYREAIIKQYDTDLAKRNGFIAMEHRPHLKTGQYKTKVGELTGVNKLDMDLLRKIKMKIELSKKPVYDKPMDRSDINRLRVKYPISHILSKYGVDTSTRNTTCPLGHPSVGKKCLNFDDNKGLWYCFNCGLGGDFITLVQEKHGISFLEALERLKNNDI